MSQWNTVTTTISDGSSGLRALICPQCHGQLNQHDLSSCPYCGTQFELSESERRRREAKKIEEERKFVERQQWLREKMEETTAAIMDLQGRRMEAVFTPKYRRLRKQEWELMDWGHEVGLDFAPAPYVFRWDLPLTLAFVGTILVSMAVEPGVIAAAVGFFISVALLMVATWRYGRFTVPDQVTEDRDG